MLSCIKLTELQFSIHLHTALILPTARTFEAIASFTMATSTKIALTGTEELSYAVTPLRKDSALKASLLLNENHKKHDIYMNDLGHHVSTTRSCSPS